MKRVERRITMNRKRLVIKEQKAFGMNKLIAVLMLTIMAVLMPVIQLHASGAENPQKAELIVDGEEAGTNKTVRQPSAAKTESVLKNHENVVANEEVDRIQPEDSFLYRYEEIIAEREAIAEQKRIEEEERKRAEAEQKRLEEARKNVARLSEAQINELFSADYFSRRLLEMGFYKEDFSDSSLNRRNAIIRLQSSINHPINATLDLVSKKALVEDGAIHAIDEISNPPSDSYWIAINKSKNILTVYQGSKIYKKYPVATGKRATLTPEGKFSIVSKAVNPAWGGAGISAPIAGGASNNPLGKRWMGLSIGGGGQYGVHGNASATSIGTYASMGCVRMINTDVVELYDYIPTGTPVWIGTDSKLIGWGIQQYNSNPGELAVVEPEPETEPEPEPEQEPEPIDEDKAMILKVLSSSDSVQAEGTTAE